jgi:hypothetical protein
MDATVIARKLDNASGSVSAVRLRGERACNECVEPDPRQRIPEMRLVDHWSVVLFLQVRV